MWVVGPFFLQKKHEGLKRVVRKALRLKKMIIISFTKLKRRLYNLAFDFFKKLWQNKIVTFSSLVVVFTVFIVVSVMTSERFPYDLKTLLNSQEFLSLLKRPVDNSSYIEMGSGLLAFNRSEDIEYAIKEDETLPEIAYLYNLELVELMLYNNISSLETVVGGQKIKIPSARNIMEYMDNIDRGHLTTAINAQKMVKRSQNLLPKVVGITCEKRSDGQSITAVFSVANEIKEKGVYFEWDLGDGKKSFRKTFNYTYNAPGIYNVSLTVKDIYGNLVRSNPIYLDIPFATNIKNNSQLFITVNNVGDVFSVDGEVYSVYDALGRIKDPIQFVNKTEDGRYNYQTHASGYYSLLAQTKTGERKIYLFVSPFDSVHNDRNDVDWYRTQYNTGLSNCGPTIASMGIAWSKGEYVSVTTIRDMIGWSGDGATSFFDLKRVLDNFKVESSISSVRSKEDLFRMLDKGSIIGFVYNCGGISGAKDQSQFDLVGKYYQDAVGHYSVLKGYTKDRKYFIIYDPIPSDWINNGLRYGDGVSMIGKNRYYPAEEVYQSMYSGIVLEFLRSSKSE
jgi:PKD repeat protein